MSNRKTAIIVITCIVGIIGFFLICGANKAIDWSQVECDTYRSHHRPNPGWYYSVENVAIQSGKTFVIGTNVKPLVGGTVVKNGGMVQIEVPTKRAGAPKGAYLIVRDVDGVPTTVYFVGEKEVVLDALQN